MPAQLDRVQNGITALVVQQRVLHFLGWFLVYTATIYLFINFLCAPLVGRVHDWILPLFSQSARSSRFELLFSHIFEFTFFPGLVAGLIELRHQSRAALFVWTVPAAVLAYRLATFPVSSVLQNHLSIALRFYFSRQFSIPEFSNFTDLFTRVASTPDTIRGMEQLHVTGPFYAAIGFSVAALLSLGLRKAS